jgi:hypothetical protein
MGSGQEATRIRPSLLMRPVTLAFSIVVAPLAVQAPPRGYLPRLGVLAPSPQ